MSKLDFLNRITNIILGRERILISSAQLAQVIELQEELADELAIQQSEFSLAALVVLQVFYYLRGDGDALSAEFSAPSLRNEVCEKAREIVNNYRSLFPDQRYMLPSTSTFEELELMQSAIDGDAAAQNALSHLFESMGNQEAANYWLKEAIALNPDNEFIVPLEKEPSAPLTTILEEPLEGYTQDSNTETEGATNSPSDKKEVPPTPVNSDAEPEVLSEPQDTTLIIESSGEKGEMDTIERQAQDELVDFFRPDEEAAQPLQQPPRMSPETIQNLEMKAEWDEAYRILKSGSPMVISTRTVPASPSIPSPHAPVAAEEEEYSEDQEMEEDEEEEIFYEARDVEIADIAYEEDDLIKFLDEQQEIPSNTTEVPAPNNAESVPPATTTTDSLNDISLASFDAAVREIKATPDELLINIEDDEPNHNQTKEKSIDRLSPEVIQQLELDAEEQAFARLANSTSSPPNPAPVPVPPKLSPEVVEKIQRKAEDEEAVRLQAIDVAEANQVPVLLEAIPASPREIEFEEFIKEEDSLAGKVTSESDDEEDDSINENSAEFESAPELPIESATEMVVVEEEVAEAAEPAAVQDFVHDSYPNDIVEAYTQQIDSLSTPDDFFQADTNELAEEVELVPIDSTAPIEPVSATPPTYHPSLEEEVSLDHIEVSPAGGKVQQVDMLQAIAEKNAGLTLKIPTTSMSTIVSGEGDDPSHPEPAVIRERQPAGTPSMEILPFPKPATPVLTSTALVKPEPKKTSTFCCGLF